MLRGRDDKVIVRNDKVIGRNNKVIVRNDKVVGRNDMVIGRNDKVIGRNDKVKGRNDKVIGRSDKVIGRNDKSRTSRTMISHDLASARFRARSGKTEGQGILHQPEAGATTPGSAERNLMGSKLSCRGASVSSKQ